MPPRKRAAQTITIDEAADANTIADQDGDKEDGSRSKHRKLSAQDLGVTEQSIEDFDGEFPTQAYSDAKYKVFYDALDDSYDRDVSKVVKDPEIDKAALQSALRNAASRKGIGVDTRLVDDVLYFKAREKRVVNRRK